MVSADAPLLALDDADWLIGSPDDAEPIVLEEGDDSLAVEPPDTWQADAHEAMLTADPYTEVALAPGAAFLNGFSACDRSVIGTFKVPGTTRYLPVRRETAPLLIGFAAEFHRLVENIDGGQVDDWGYACRAVRGSTVTSYHAPGIAIDLNSLLHALGRRGTFTPRQATVIRALCRKYGLRWGGDYVNRADEMHMEIILSRTAALALVKRLQTPPPPKPRDPVLYRGMAMSPYLKSKVTDVQRALNMLGNRLVLDGDYGAATEKIVRVFQTNRRHALTVDGRFTQDDWDLLRVAIAKYR